MYIARKYFWFFVQKYFNCKTAKNILVHSFIFTRLILNATFNFNFFDFAMKLSIQILYYWLEQIMRLLLMCNFCWFCWILLEILPWEDEWFSQLWWVKNDSKRLVHRDFIALINSPDHELSANTKISVIRNIPNFPPLNLALGKYVYLLICQLTFTVVNSIDPHRKLCIVWFVIVSLFRTSLIWKQKVYDKGEKKLIMSSFVYSWAKLWPISRCYQLKSSFLHPCSQQHFVISLFIIGRINLTKGLCTQTQETLIIMNYHIAAAFQSDQTLWSQTSHKISMTRSHSSNSSWRTINDCWHKQILLPKSH